MLFELKFSWKLSEAKCAGSLGTLKKQIVLNICDCFKKMSKAISHIERTVNVLGEDPTCTKIRITNAGKDKQKSFEARLVLQYRKHGFHAFYYVYCNFLTRVDAPGGLAHFTHYASTI